MSDGLAIAPVDLAAALIRCPSVTPGDGGALGVVQAAVEPLGFACHRLTFSEPGTPDVANLYARVGGAAPNFCFAGHTDVVPVGDAAAWTHDPFGAELVDGVLYGRGAADMKSAIASFISAAARFLEARGDGFGGSISLLITGDEDGPAVNGTRKVLEWMAANGETIDGCVVGEPTNPGRLGEMVKIGRRGSLTGRLTVHGVQGHAGYPHLADNPVPRLVRTLAALLERRLDEGNEHFERSNLEVTTVDVGNPVENVIPARASAAFNIRFNDSHTGDGLEAWLRACCAEHAGAHDLDVRVSGEAFLTPPGALSELVCGAIERVLGARPVLGTAGGTSDARFIKDVCPVVEFGLVGQTMHGIDERIAVADVRALADVYAAVLDAYFPN